MSNNLPTPPDRPDRAKTVHHSRHVNFISGTSNNDDEQHATQNAARATITTRPESELKAQQLPRPLPPPKPPPPRPRRPRPGTTTENHARQRATNNVHTCKIPWDPLATAPPPPQRSRQDTAQTTEENEKMNALALQLDVDQQQERRVRKEHCARLQQPPTPQPPPEPPSDPQRVARVGKAQQLIPNPP